MMKKAYGVLWRFGLTIGISYAMNRVLLSKSWAPGLDFESHVETKYFFSA
jgi:hypothetical protein